MKHHNTSPLKLGDVSVSAIILEEREQTEERLLMATFRQSIAEMVVGDLIPRPDAKKELGI